MVIARRTGYSFAVRRFLVIAAILSSLAGCGGQEAGAFLDSRTPPALGPRFWPPAGWAWGVLRVEGAPEVRYGVASPAGRPAGHVIFVSGYGESAEVYFESARDLLDRGYAVWTLEPHGQGGSGRFRGPADIGRSAGFDRDAAALRALVEQFIRPAQDDLVVVSANGSGALTVLLAVQDGLRRVDRLHLSHPDLTPEPSLTARRLTQVGLGMLRARGAAWRRPEGDLTNRPALPAAWQAANPDLRMGGPGWSWLDAEARAVDAASNPEAVARVTVPVVMAASARNRPAAELCAKLPDCTGLFDRPTAPSHLSRGEARKAWLAVLLQAIEDPAPAVGAHGV